MQCHHLHWKWSSFNINAENFFSDLLRSLFLFSHFRITLYHSVVFIDWIQSTFNLLMYLLSLLQLLFGNNFIEIRKFSSVSLFTLLFLNAFLDLFILVQLCLLARCHFHSISFILYNSQLDDIVTLFVIRNRLTGIHVSVIFVVYT